MSKPLFYIFALILSTFGQNVVNRVRVRDHREYMHDVIQDVIKTIEDRGWWTLKLPDIQKTLNETVFTQNYQGTVTYKNGFLISIHGIDVLQSSLNQIWAVAPDRDTTQVSLTGQLRMTDVALGYDVEANLNDQTRHYTGVITQPMLTYMFTVIRNLNKEEFTDVTVVGAQTTATARTMEIRPLDRTASALTALFDRTSTLEGIRTWTSIFQSIALEGINNRVPFPGLCYNCPVS